MIAKSATLRHDEHHRVLCKVSRASYRLARLAVAQRIIRLLLLRARYLDVAPVQVHGALADSLYQ